MYSSSHTGVHPVGVLLQLEKLLWLSVKKDGCIGQCLPEIVLDCGMVMA
jgi:hypothetical protein